MTAEELEQLRFPIGKYIFDETISAEAIQQQIQWLADFPKQLNALVQDFDETKRLTTYRPDGWTVAQVVHHIADSHMNAYIRCKLAITENNPTIKPYKEQYWSETVDGRSPDISISLSLIEGVHQRWAMFLQSLNETELERTVYHPQYEKTVSVKYIIGSYTWHSRHHFEHIHQLKLRSGW